MAASQKNSAVVTAKARDTIALPAMTLGFASLTKPDEFDPEKPQFKMNAHLTPEAITALAAIVREKVYTEATLSKLRSEAQIVKMKLKEPMDAQEWVEDKLKEPKEGSRQPLPHIILKNNAYMGQGPKRKLREITCWSADNKKLNLAKLRLGAGSVIQAIVYPNIYASKVAGCVPQPSLKLVGIRVLKLVQWGGDRPPEAMDDEDVREVLGADFEFDDLSSYAAGGEDTDDSEDDDDRDDPGAPPSDVAEGMF